MTPMQTMLLYLVGTVERLAPASPLLKGTRLPVDSILEGAGLMAGQKSAPLARHLIADTAATAQQPYSLNWLVTCSVAADWAGFLEFVCAGAVSYQHGLQIAENC